jgi:hypothetical protein
MQEAQISLSRSLRIPEDGRDYELPPGLGTFPIYDVRSFSGHLPVSMVAQGGLFLPMYRKYRKLTMYISSKTNLT